MIKNAPPKHPDSTKWYWLEWSSDELQESDIETSTWTVPEGITQETDSMSGYRVGIRISGATLDQDYELVNQIQTSNGETLHESILIRCRLSGH